MGVYLASVSEACRALPRTFGFKDPRQRTGPRLRAGSTNQQRGNMPPLFNHGYFFLYKNRESVINCRER